MEKRELRFEKKFVVHGMIPELIDAWVRAHPAQFSIPFPDRQINNIYYDTPELRCYAENIAGVNQRRKFRIRWYGNFHDPIVSAKLESKYKHNELGGKDRYKIEAFDLTKPPILDRQLHAQIGMDMMIPVLANSYLRRYYRSADRKFRLTIDKRIRFGSFLNRPHEIQLDMEQTGYVIEIKYMQKFDPEVHSITNHLPFRQSKNSKYVMGVQMTNS
jgi:hypothetical protein